MIGSTFNLKEAPKIASKKLGGYSDENLVYYFNPYRNFIENTNVVNDYSSSNFTSTFVSPVWEKNYVNFNGINQYVQIGDVTSFNFLHQTKTWTSIFWVRNNAQGGRSFIIGNSPAARAERGVCFILEYGTTDLFGVCRFNCMRAVAGTTAINGVTDDFTINKNDKWFMLAYSPQSGVVGQWYINGEPINTSNRYEGVNTNGGAQSGSNANRIMRIGGINGASPLYYNGDMGEVLMYTRVLSDDEILSFYRNNKKYYN